MKIVKSLLVLSAFAVIFGGIFATAAIAQSPKGSSLTLEKPLEIGDTILEPGAYLITVVPGDRRDVLKVTGEDGRETFATVLTTPHTATATAEQKRTQYVYFPTTADSTRTLKTWFAPDSAAGHGYDIVYPKTRAMELATVANGPVVAYKDGTLAADLTTTELEVVSPNKEVHAYVAPGGAVADDRAEPVEVAATHRDHPVTARELPATASRLPLLAALGFLLLLAAGGVKILRTV